jgi:adhesin/invasin
MRLSRALLAATVVLGLPACHDSIIAPLTASTIVTTTQGQVATVGQPLAQVISVHVTDANGIAVPNIVVSWSLPAGEGAVDSVTSTTNAEGDATAHWTLGTIAGSDSLQASVASGVAVEIYATAMAGPVTALAMVSGDAQVIAVGAATQPLVLKATDLYGNPVANASITWSVTGDGVINTSSSVTDANGLTQDTLTSESTPGSYTVTASDDVGTVTFTVTAD